MTQLKHVVEPFGEVNVLPGPAGAVQVRATILMEPQKEGAQTGIAFDGCQHSVLGCRVGLPHDLAQLGGFHARAL